MMSSIAELTPEVTLPTVERSEEIEAVTEEVGRMTVNGSVELMDNAIQPEASHPDCRQADKVCPAACNASDHCVAQ